MTTMGLRPCAFLSLLCIGLGALGCARKAPPPQYGAPTADASTHRVRPGETLRSIAARYGVDVEKLAKLNAIRDPNRIRVDQRLRLPEGVRPAPPEPHPREPPNVYGPGPDPVLSCTSHKDAPDDWGVSASGLSWPVDGVVLTRFGRFQGGRHEGLAIGAPLGTPVWSSDAGRVVLADAQPGYGQLVVVDHGKGRVGLYGSLERACVQKGDRVRRGTLIGLVGVSSGVASPRLYFELREANRPVNPRAELP